MDAKKILTNKSFCVLPWTGFELEPNGNIKNCIISTSTIGNIQEQDIENTPWNKDIKYFFEHIKILDSRRNQSWQTVFPELFKELKNV